MKMDRKDDMFQTDDEIEFSEQHLCSICNSEKHTTSEHYQDIMCNKEMLRK